PKLPIGHSEAAYPCAQRLSLVPFPVLVVRRVSMITDLERLHPRYDLDMARLEDEQLVVLVQECAYVPAREELISRCNGLKDRLIHHLAARTGLQEADRMDAQQDAVLWILEAIREYNTGQQVMPRGC